MKTKFTKSNWHLLGTSKGYYIRSDCHKDLRMIEEVIIYFKESCKFI